MASPKMPTAAEELTQAPQLESLGTINPDTITAPPKSAVWESDGVSVEMSEPLPPWETDPKGERANSDARRFIDVPDNIELRWINPKLIDHVGWRYWEAVPARGDKRFRLKNKQLGRPDNTVRLGGPNGDILAWMYKSWVEKRKKQKEGAVYKLAKSAVDRHQETRERLRRGDYGPYVSDGGGTHPTHTIADGRTMQDT